MVFIRPLQPELSGFIPVAPVAGFHSVAEFQGDLFLCGRSSLFRYRGGNLQETWTVGRDLPPFPLRTIATRSGIHQPELWIATAGAGILIYDGQRFRQLLPEQLKLRDVTALLPFRSGRVLIGTASSGLYLSDGASLRLYHPQFANIEVSALAGNEDEFWVGTRNQGAWFWRGGEARHVINQLPDRSVLSITVTDRQAWIGTPLGVSEFQNGEPARRLAEGVFARALAPHNGALWIGTLDQGVLSVPLANHPIRPQPAEIQARTGSVSAFVVTDQELLALDQTSLRDAKSGKLLIAAPLTSLVDGHITSLHVDSQGSLWIGYFNRGLDILDLRDTAKHARHLEDDVLFCINRIKEDRARSITAVATANGLVLFDASRRVRQVLDQPHGLIASHVTDILFRQGGSAAATVVATPAGLSSINRDDVSSISGFQGLVNNHVYTLADLDGTLYAGTLGGVSLIHNGSVQASFNSANSQLRQNWITASTTADSKLYLGTYGSGVVQLERNGVTVAFPAFAHQRTEINPNAMLTAQRAIYAGTSTRGLSVMRRGEDRWQFITAGLPSLNVTAIEENQGTLYVGTDNGLVRIAETSLLP